MRRRLAALAVADALLLASATVGALTAERGDLRAKVLDRPWPARVTPTGPWSATLEGTGPRFTMTTVVGFIPDGLGEATFRLPDPDERRSGSRTLNLTLPDGSTWHPKGTFRLEAAGPLAFTSVGASDGALVLGVGSLQSVLGPATGPVTAVGTFVAADGRQVDRLALPLTTHVGEDCGRKDCVVPYEVPQVSVAVSPGTTLGAKTGVEAGEVAVAGAARAAALGRTWNGLVGAVEGLDLAATATWDGQTWSVNTTAGAAHQVWVDVWPVATTTLSVTSYLHPGMHSCFGNCSVRLRWANTGWATSQIYEAEGVGRGSGSVAFGLAKSSGHDAGLGIGRGRTRNLGSGAPVSSSQAPGQDADRGLSSSAAADVTLVLRGNFPEVRVRLAVPAGIPGTTSAWRSRPAAPRRAAPARS